MSTASFTANEVSVVIKLRKDLNNREEPVVQTDRNSSDIVLALAKVDFVDHEVLVLLSLDWSMSVAIERVLYNLRP